MTTPLARSFVLLFLLAFGPLEWFLSGKEAEQFPQPYLRHEAQGGVDKVLEESERRRLEDEGFRVEYLKLPSHERVALWRKDPSYYREGALIVQGTDAVPSLVEIVRDPKERLETRYRAMLILCRMDRFVPLSESPVPVYHTVGSKEVGFGRINPYFRVDGRRIGKEGYEALQWAAEQTKDKELRFHARDLLGWLEQELRDLSLDSQVRRWQRAITRGRGGAGFGLGDPDEGTTADNLRALLVEKAPESLPALVNLLEESRNPYVREGVISILESIDTDRVRLRTLEVGRRAIEATRRAFEKGNLKPAFTSRESRQREWARLSAQFFKDNWLSFKPIPSAFEAFYGEKLVFDRVPPGVEDPRKRAQFIAFLTEVDPYFVCWEFCAPPDPSDAVFHPRFRVKMDRYYEQWKRFKTQQQIATPTLQTVPPLN